MNATPAVHVAYAPRGAGVMCALFYIVVGKDVYGWWGGAQGAEFVPAFFLLEDFFSTRDTVFFATRGSDIYGGWRYRYSDPHPDLDESVPVDEETCHRLNQLQYAFESEWLFFADDSHIEEELAAYGQGELAVQAANIKSARLHKLDQGDAVWTYTSPEFDMDVLDYLMERWPLDYNSR